MLCFTSKVLGRVQKYCHIASLDASLPKIYLAYFHLEEQCNWRCQSKDTLEARVENWEALMFCFSTNRDIVIPVLPINKVPWSFYQTKILLLQLRLMGQLIFDVHKVGKQLLHKGTNSNMHTVCTTPTKISFSIHCSYEIFHLNLCTFTKKELRTRNFTWP